jgi:hypothetical protein
MSSTLNKKPARTGRVRELTEDQWRRESGQDQPGYAAAASRFYAAAKANAAACGVAVMDDDITVRS